MIYYFLKSDNIWFLFIDKLANCFGVINLDANVEGD